MKATGDYRKDSLLRNRDSVFASYPIYEPVACLGQPYLGIGGKPLDDLYLKVTTLARHSAAVATNLVLKSTRLVDVDRQLHLIGIS